MVKWNHTCLSNRSHGVSTRMDRMRKLEVCDYHLCDNPIEGRRRVYCSQKCRNKSQVIKHRHKLKRYLVELKGGKCVECGYNKSMSALQFHHVDPSTKSFGIAAAGVTRSYAELEAEVEKCILLCANCHAEVTGGH